MKDLFAKLDHNYSHVMIQVIPVILTFHTHGTGISAGIISALYKDHICSVYDATFLHENLLICRSRWGCNGCISLHKVLFSHGSSSFFSFLLIMILILRRIVSWKVVYTKYPIWYEIIVSMNFVSMNFFLVIRSRKSFSNQLVMLFFYLFFFVYQNLILRKTIACKVVHENYYSYCDK